MISSVKRTDQKRESTFLGNNYSKDDQSVLGMCWDQFLDVLYYDVKLNFSPKRRGVHMSGDLQKSDVPSQIPLKLTKRLVLSIVNSTFDPAGLITPFTVRGNDTAQEPVEAKIGMGRPNW